MSKTHNPTKVTNFHYAPYQGVMEGIPLSANMLSRRNDGTFYPLQLRCGDRYIMLDRNHQPLIQNLADGTVRVINADVVPFTSLAGKTFNLLSKSEGNSVLLFVQTRSTDQRIKEKFPATAWENVIIDGSSGMIMSSVGLYLVRMIEGGSVYIFLRNGAVTKVEVRGGRCVETTLSLADMATQRVEQMQDQLSKLSDPYVTEVVLLHGILGGASRMLCQFIAIEDVRHIFVNFLLDHLEDIPRKSKQDVRQALLSVNDIYAGNFVEGYENNVVQFNKHHKTTAISEQLAAATRRRSARRIKDREVRAEMRGPSGGGRRTTKSK